MFLLWILTSLLWSIDDDFEGTNKCFYWEYSPPYYEAWTDDFEDKNSCFFFWEYSLSYDEAEIYDFEGKNVFTDNTHFPIMKQR